MLRGLSVLIACFVAYLPFAGCNGSVPDAGAVPAPSLAPPVENADASSVTTLATEPARPATPAACPPEMALVNGRFCIDRWEASLEDPDGKPHSPHRSVGPLKVRALSRAGVLPQAYISAEEGDLACKRAGKHLCRTQEWQDACMGASRPYRIYPYGMERKPAACNTNRPMNPGIKVFGEIRHDSVSMNDPRLNQVEQTVAPTGEFDQCVTPEGVFDMEGNLLEWTQGDKKALLMGGHYLDSVKHGKGCRYVTAGHGAEYHDYTTGFRCCQSMNRAAPEEPNPNASTAEAGAPRDPPGMRSFIDAVGTLPKPTPPAYDPPDAACPTDMALVEGLRCAEPVQHCKSWLPRLSHGEKIACSEFEAPSECSGQRRKMSYCIDRYEYQPPGYDYPLTHVNWGEAQNLCNAMDKRLCMEAEWEFACEGPGALPFPYGYVRDGERCNHDFDEEDLAHRDQFIDRRVAKDALPRCVSPFGVFNMVGNVDEWTTRDGGKKPRRAILRGGWWLIGRNRCRAATANHSELYAGVQTGFRCCKASRPHAGGGP